MGSTPEDTAEYLRLMAEGQALRDAYRSKEAIQPYQQALAIADRFATYGFGRDTTWSTRATHCRMWLDALNGPRFR